MNVLIKTTVSVLSGLIGWFIGVFQPTFPLIIVALCFIFWDVYSAFMLDKRVHTVYPDKVAREKAHFTSFKFGKIVGTIINSCLVILLMYATRIWVMSGIYDVPLDYIATAIIIAWQGLSVLENNASCPLPGDKDSRFWATLRSVLIDKTERHFDINLSDMKNNERNKETTTNDNA